MTVHRLLEQGNDTYRLQALATIATGAALIPPVLALSMDIYVAVEPSLGRPIGLTAAAAMAIFAAGSWFAPAFWPRTLISAGKADMKQKAEVTPLSDKIRHVLTEARVVLPGAQALPGFALIATLMDGFEKLPLSSKYIHFFSLSMVAISIVLLMTPATYHRLVEHGEETEHFHQLAGRLVIASLIPLGLALSADFYVAVCKITDNPPLSAGVAIIMLAFLFGTWFGTVIWLRQRHTKIPKF